MRRKLSNKLFVIVAQGAVGAWTDDAYEGKFYDLNFPEASSSLRTWEVFVLLVVGLNAALKSFFWSRNSFNSSTRSCKPGKLNLHIFSEFILSPPAPWHHFLSLTSDFKRGDGKLSKSNSNSAAASLRSAKCARNFICTWASGCLWNLQLHRNFSLTLQVGGKNEEPDTWWKCKHSLLSLMKRICVIECLLYGRLRADGFPSGPQKSP